MLLFMTLFRMSAHVHDVLLMHRHQVIEEVLPRLQQKREDQRIAFRLGEALEVWRTIALGQREEVIEERGSHARGFKRIEPRRGDVLIGLVGDPRRLGDRGQLGVVLASPKLLDQAAGGDAYTATDPETNSAYGATVGSCIYIRLIARALEAAGPNPMREDLAAAMEGLGAIDTGGAIPGSFAKGKYTAPNALNKLTFHYPCEPDQLPFDGICILPDGDAFPIPNDQ